MDLVGDTEGPNLLIDVVGSGAKMEDATWCAGELLVVFIHSHGQYSNAIIALRNTRISQRIPATKLFPVPHRLLG